MISNCLCAHVETHTKIVFSGCVFHGLKECYQQKIISKCQCAHVEIHTKVVLLVFLEFEGVLLRENYY